MKYGANNLIVPDSKIEEEEEEEEEEEGKQWWVAEWVVRRCGD